MKRLFLCALSVFLLLCLPVGLSSCRETQGGEPPADSIELISNGQALYTLVYPDGASDKVFVAVDSFVKAVQKLTGVSMDAVKVSMIDRAKTDRFLYVGNTGCEVSTNAMAELKDYVDTYSISAAGKDITVVGMYDVAVQAALAYYQAELLEKNYDAETRTLRFEEYFFRGEVPLPQSFDRANLEKYVIVYPVGDEFYKSVATLLRDQIKLSTGYNLPLLTSVKEQNPYEILLGNTGRAASTRAYAQGFDVMKAHMYVEDGQLQFVSGGSYSAKREVEKFLTSFLIGGCESLAEGIHYPLDLIPELHERTEGSDARIMTLNILADYVVKATEQDALCVGMRAEIFAGMLLRYAPDMIGMQECDGAWSREIESYLPILKERYGMDYRLLLSTYEKYENCITIVYNADRFTCEFSQYHPYEYKPLTAGTTRTVRGAAVAKLTSVADPGVQILLFSSHWDHTSEAAMNSCATEEAALIRMYREKFPQAAVFCTGDFNSHKFNGTFLKQFVKEVGGAIASDLARANGTLAIDGGYHSAGFIDHIIGEANGYSVLYHNTILNNSCKQMTDHAPIYADIKLS